MSKPNEPRNYTVFSADNTSAFALIIGTVSATNAGAAWMLATEKHGDNIRLFLEVTR